MKPYISILVPIYKVPEKFLVKCIESLINQTLKNIEIILVDDGSPDDCGKICDKYAASDKRIKVIHKENGGLVATRNTAYEASVGKWITFVDDDDWLDPETCEKLLSIGEEYDPEIIIWNNVQELGRYSIKNGWKDDPILIYYGDDCQILKENVLNFKSKIASAYCKLIKRDFAEENCLTHNDKLKQGAEGIEFSVRVFDKAKKVVYLNEYFYHYRNTDKSMSKSVNEKNTKYIIDCFVEIEKYYHETNATEEMWKQFYNRILVIVSAIAMSCYFNVDNSDPYSIKRQKFISVLDNIIFIKAFKNGNINDLDFSRKVAVLCAKHKFTYILLVLARLKYFYLKFKGI